MFKLTKKFLIEAELTFSASVTHLNISSQYMWQAPNSFFNQTFAFFCLTYIDLQLLFCHLMHTDMDIQDLILKFTLVPFLKRNCKSMIYSLSSISMLLNTFINDLNSTFTAFIKNFGKMIRKPPTKIRICLTFETISIFSKSYIQLLTCFTHKL